MDETVARQNRFPCSHKRSPFEAGWPRSYPVQANGRVRLERNEGGLQFRFGGADDADPDANDLRIMLSEKLPSALLGSFQRGKTIDQVLTEVRAIRGDDFVHG
jgi:hypothetical protein